MIGHLGLSNEFRCFEHLPVDMLFIGLYGDFAHRQIQLAIRNLIYLDRHQVKIKTTTKFG